MSARETPDREPSVPPSREAEDSDGWGTAAVALLVVLFVLAVAATGHSVVATF